MGLVTYRHYEFFLYPLQIGNMVHTVGNKITNLLDRLKRVNDPRQAYGKVWDIPSRTLILKNFGRCRNVPFLVSIKSYQCRSI